MKIKHIFLIFLLICSCEVRSIKVIQSTNVHSEFNTTFSGATVLNSSLKSLNLSKDATICARYIHSFSLVIELKKLPRFMMFQFYTDSHIKLLSLDIHYLLSVYVSSRELWDSSKILKGMELTKFAINGVNLDYKNTIGWPVWKLNTWNSVCIVYEINQETKVFSNANLVATFNSTLNDLFQDKNFILLATANDIPDTKYRYSAFGAATDFNIWSRAMSIESMKKWISFEDESVDDKVLDWNNIQIDQLGLIENNVEKQEILEQSFAKEEKSINFFPPETKNFFEGAYFCENLGGQVAVPGDNFDVDLYNFTIGNIDNNCKEKHFLGYLDPGDRVFLR